MVKRVFAIIGIVVASVGAFVGGVFGVLALMGKFKTPDVYPESLYFVDEGQVVVSNSKKEEDKFLHYFELVGTTSNQEHGVNHTKCEVWFVDNVGKDLIELCDANGNKLSENEGRFEINCNEKTYYKIKSSNGLTYNSQNKLNGKVVLMARSENKRAISPAFTFWIDREVEKVGLLKDGSLDVGSPQDPINVNLNIDSALPLTFGVAPEISLRPIDKFADAKEVELYYCGKQSNPTMEDYVKVTKASVQENEELRNLIYFVGNDMFFKTTEIGIYNFKVAAFKSYESKVKFEEFVATMQDYKNYDKLTQTEYLTVNDLKINVSNLNVEQVDIAAQSVVLNMYSENDYITLSGSTGKENVNENNLKMLMIQGGSNTELRFDEVVFNKLSEIELMPGASFQTDDGNSNLDSGGIDRNNADIISTKKIRDNLEIVDYVETNAKKYHSSNGVAVYDGIEEKFYHIPVGCYLDFYIDNGSILSLVNTEFEFVLGDSFNVGANRSWNITATKLDLDAGKTLKIAIMVVNSEGTWQPEYLFDSIEVSVEEKALEYNLKQSEITLDIDYVAGEQSYEELPVIYNSVLAKNGIIEITQGTYTSCVFVTPAAENYAFEIVDKFKFTVGEGDDAKTYYLVGYLDANGRFVNNIRVNPNGNTRIGYGETSQMHILQLKNNYKQTAEQLIKELLSVNGLYELNDQNPYFALFNEKENIIDVKINFKINPSVINAEFNDGNPHISGVGVYENTDEHTITLSSSEGSALVDLYNFYVADEEDLKGIEEFNKLFTVDARYTNNLIINSVAESESIREDVANYDSESEIFTGVGSADYTIKESGKELWFGANLLAKFDGASLKLAPDFAGKYEIDYDNKVVYKVTKSNTLTLTFSTRNALNNTDTPIEILFSYNKQAKEIGPIYILSNSPERIKFKFDLNGRDIAGLSASSITDVELATTTDSVLSMSEYIKITIKGEPGGNYIYDYEFAGISYDLTGVGVISEFKLLKTDFNSKTSKDDDPDTIDVVEGLGFQDAGEYKAELDVRYGSGNKTLLELPDNGIINDLSDLTVHNVGTTYLRVKIGNTTNYIRVEIVAHEDFKFAGNSIQEVNGTSFKLKKDQGIQLMYNETAMSQSALQINEHSFNDIISPNAYLIYNYDESTSSHRLVDSSNPKNVVLSVKYDEDDWTFTRVSSKYVGLSFKLTLFTAVGNKTYDIVMTSDVEVMRNTEWEGNILYRGTTIKLYEATNSAFIDNALIQVKLPTGMETSKVKVYVGETQVGTNEGKFQVDSGTMIGESEVLSFSIKYDENGNDPGGEIELQTLNYIIKENLFVELTGAKEVESGTDYLYTDLFNLTQFKKIDTVFGTKIYSTEPGADNSSVIGTYNQVKDYQAADHIEPFTDYANVKVNLIADEEIGTDNNSLLKVPNTGYDVTTIWRENLREVLTASWEIKYNENSINIDNTDVKFINRYEVSSNNTGSGYVEEKDGYTLSTHTEYNPFITLSGDGSENFKLTKIEFVDDLGNVITTIESSKISKYSIGALDKPYTNVKVKFTFTHNTDATKTLTYETNANESITINPYVPTKKDDYTAYSGNSFDLIRDVFIRDVFKLLTIDRGNKKFTNLLDTDNYQIVNENELQLIDGITIATIDGNGVVEISNYYKSNYIVDGDNICHVEFSNLKSITVEAIRSSAGNSGSAHTDYIEGDLTSSSNSCPVTFKDINGDSIKCYVVYKITYNDGDAIDENDVVYEYILEFTITNRQSITPTYVMNNDSMNIPDSVDFNFVKTEVNNSEVESSLYADYQQKNKDETYIKRFEPILLSTNASVTLDFATASGYARTQRISVKNLRGSGEEKIVKVEKVAYQNIVGLKEYFEDDISCTSTGVVLSPASAGTRGYVIFKITSESGNITYYTVYIYSLSSDYNVSSEKNIVVDTQGGETTFETILGNGVVDYDNNFFKTSSGQTYKSYSYIENKIEAYVVDATSTAPLSVGEVWDSVGLTKNQLVYSSIFGNAVDVDISTVATYTTIRVVLVLKDGAEMYPFGTIDYILQPTDKEDPLDGNLQHKNAGISDGLYTYNLGANPVDIIAPFNSVSGAVILNTFADDFIKLDGTTLKVQKYSTEEVNFSVRYNVGNLYLIVDYTLEATSINETEQKTVGAFDTDLGAFNNRLYLSEVVGPYVGQIGFDASNKITIGESGGEKTINAGVIAKYDASLGWYLWFNQTTSNQVFDLTLTYLNYQIESGDNFVQSLRVVVTAGVYQPTPTNVVGTQASTRLETTKTNTYNSLKGSSITINVETLTESGYSNYFKYTIVGTGIAIYSLEALTLNFDSSISGSGLSYLINDAGTGYNCGAEITVEENKTIYFTHLLKAKNIDISIKSGNFTCNPLYVTAVSTYDELVAKYLVKDATYENVTSEEQFATGNFFNGVGTIEEKGTDTEVNSTARLAAKVGSDYKFTLSAMGFNNSKNPNYLTFEAGENCNIIDTVTGTKVKFNAVTSMADASVIIKYAGANLTYNFQIMPEAIDGLNLNTTDGYTDGSYVSYVVDLNNNTNVKEDLVVGNSLDQKLTFMYLTDIVASVVKEDGNNASITSSITKQLIVNDVYSYTVGLSSYGTITLTYKFSEKANAYQLFVKYEKSPSTPATFNELKLLVTAYGSTSKIANALNITFFNYSIIENYSGANRQSVYAGKSQEIVGEIVDNNADLPFEVNDLSLEFELLTTENIDPNDTDKLSSYVVDGNTKYFADTDNDLFTYENKLMTTNSVGQDIYVDLKFNVISNSVVIKTVTYQFVLKLNLQFTVNGENVDNNMGNTTFTTNLVLTPDDINTPSLNAIRVLNLTDDITGENKYSTGKEYYYNRLKLNLYTRTEKTSLNIVQVNVNIRSIELLDGTSLKIKGDEDPTTLETIKSKMNEIVMINNGIFTFKKDCSGKIVLNVSVDTDCGTYSVIWTIDVTPILDIRYLNTDYDTAVITNSGAPYKSFDTVIPISSQDINNYGHAIQMTKDTMFNGLTNIILDKTHVSFDSDVANFTAEYMISDTITISDGSNSISQTFDDDSSSPIDVSLDSNYFCTFDLPNVPNSTVLNPKDYYVIYKFEFKYLGQTYTYYVAYQVRNTQSITPNVAQVNVDNLGSDYKLDLFYYQISGTHNGDTYSVVYKGNNQVELKKNSEVISTTYDESTGVYTFNGTDTLNIKENKLTISGTEVFLNTITNKYESEDGKIKSILSSDFSSLYEFKLYIDSIDATDGIKLGTTAFDFGHIGNGRFGIKLNEVGAYTGKLFTNEMIVDLKVISKGQTVYTLPAYDTDTNNGFKLFTSNTITATEIPIADIFNQNQLTYISTGWTSTKIMNLSLVGVSSSNLASNNWVSSGSAGTTTEVARFTVGDKTYKLYEVTYTSTGGALYNVSKTCYAVLGATNSQIVTIDYAASGTGSSNFIRVNFVNGLANQTLATNQLVKVWKNDASDNYKLKGTHISSPTLTIVSYNGNTTGTSLDGNVGSVGDGEILSSELQDYKNNNPTATFYQITYRVSYGGANIEFKVRYILPTTTT